MSITDDGRKIVFESSLEDLTAEDDDSALSNVYVRNVYSGDLTFVSRADGPTGEAGDAQSSRARISANGRYVAFTSWAGNLSNDHPVANMPAVYRRDLQTNSVELGSRRTNGVSVWGYLSGLTADGSKVLFLSGDPALPADSGDACGALYLRDIDSGTTQLVSRSSTGVAICNLVSHDLSADGSRLALVASDLLPGVEGDHVYVRDITTGAVQIADRADGAGAFANAIPSSIAISGDGTKVAFVSAATNLDPRDTSNDIDVFVRDLGSQTTRVVSRSPGSLPANTTHFSGLAMSHDGRRVAFTSPVDGLFTGDANASSDVLVRDTADGRLLFANRASGSQGAPGDRGSSGPALSRSGELIAFTSSATNLTTDGASAIEKVIARELEPRTYSIQDWFPFVTPGAAPLPAEPTVPSIEPVNSAPTSTMRRLKNRLKRKAFKRISGTASDDHGLRAVYVEIVHKNRKRCEWLTSNGKLKRRVCARPIALKATGTSKWTFKLKRALPAGKYEIRSYAVDKSGKISKTRLIRLKLV